MTHRLDSLMTLAEPQLIGPGNGVEVSPGRWRITFSPPPHDMGTKFLILHFTGAVFGGGDKIEINLLHDTDIFNVSSGPDFWSRPIERNSVDVDFIDGGSGTGHALLSEFGRGEGLQDGGAINTNAGLFLIDLKYKDKEVRIEKFVLLVAMTGAAAGREPRHVSRAARDKITLPRNSATMDDCYRLAELLLGAPPSSPLPLSIGFLEIVSPDKLNVTAVYTASDLKSRSVSIDVEQIEGKLKTKC